MYFLGQILVKKLICFFKRFFHSMDEADDSECNQELRDHTVFDILIEHNKHQNPGRDNDQSVENMNPTF